MIIIEGTDLVGKTTLALKLEEELGKALPYTYHHLSKPPNNFDQYWDYVPMIQRRMIYDRFHISRRAYGEALENQPLCSELEVKLLDGLIASVGGFVVVVVASEELLKIQWDLLKDKREEMYNIDEIIKVNAIYSRLILKKEIAYDYAIFLTANQWPTDFLWTILVQYKERQSQLDNLLARRPMNNAYYD